MFHRQHEQMSGVNPRRYGGNGTTEDGITPGSGMGRLFKFGERVSGLLVLVAFLPFCAQGQSAESAGAQQPGVPQAQNKIRVHTEEVIAPVTVLDKQGAPVLDLTPERLSRVRQWCRADD